MAHKQANRFRCRECSTEFCAECSATPYHLGYTCEQYVKFKDSVHCRFCDSPIKGNASQAAKDPLWDVCKDAACKEKKKLSCVKRHERCGHACGGVRDEDECLPCLHEDCCKEQQNAEDFCNICWTDGLGAAPVLKLYCGHFFHAECIIRKVQDGWPSARITFAFME